MKMTGGQEKKQDLGQPLFPKGDTSWQDPEISYQYPNVWKRGNWADDVFSPPYDWEEVETAKEKN